MLLNQYTLKVTDFDEQAEGYSKRNALFLGEASQAAYGSPEAGHPLGMQAWAKMACFNECFPFQAESGRLQKGQIEGFVAKTDKVILVSFRGTDMNVGDWLIDFQSTPVRDPIIPGLVHQGFNDGLLSVWKQIRPHLDARKDQRVWITGHSLGGALAVACAARATFESPRIGIRGIYTFGQPRFGDSVCSKACADLLGSVLFRHINDRDIVPRVPPFAPGFRHWGTEILFDRSNVAHTQPSAVEEATDLLRRFLVNPLDLGPLGNLLQGKNEEEAIRKLKQDSFQVATDHFMADAYLPLLRKLAGN